MQRAEESFGENKAENVIEPCHIINSVLFIYNYMYFITKGRRLFVPELTFSAGKHKVVIKDPKYSTQL